MIKLLYCIFTAIPLAIGVALMTNNDITDGVLFCILGSIFLVMLILDYIADLLHIGFTRRDNMAKGYSAITVREEIKDTFDILYTTHGRRMGYKTKEQFAEAIIKEYIKNHNLNKVTVKFED